MTRLTILEYPDPRLRTRATPVAAVDAPLRELIDDMLETMYAANGIGLAATQVNVHQRLLVADVSEGRNVPQVFINPEILSRDGKEVSQEGCLSVPGYYDEVERAARVRVRALGPRRQDIRERPRRPARDLCAARDRPPRRQAVRRLFVGDEAPARAQEDREGKASACRRRGNGACRRTRDLNGAAAVDRASRGGFRRNP